MTTSLDIIRGVCGPCVYRGGDGDVFQCGAKTCSSCWKMVDLQINDCPRRKFRQAHFTGFSRPWSDVSGAGRVAWIVDEVPAERLPANVDIVLRGQPGAGDRSRFWWVQDYAASHPSWIGWLRRRHFIWLRFLR